METIKERIWRKATTELNPKFQDTERNFEYEEPIIDLTLKEVLDLIDELNEEIDKKEGYEDAGHWTGRIDFIEELKSAIKGSKANNG